MRIAEGRKYASRGSGESEKHQGALQSVYTNTNKFCQSQKRHAWNIPFFSSALASTIYYRRLYYVFCSTFLHRR